MSNSDNSDGGLGNTKLTPKQESDCKRWCFTLNNYGENDIENLKKVFHSDKFIIGEEVGENGTPHLQGYVNFDKKKRLTALKKIDNRIHWEKCKGSEEDNIKYCSKDGKYVTNLKVKKPLKLLKPEQFKDWQQDIIKIIEAEPDDRKVYWFWETVGNIGKTTFCKYLSAVYGAVPIEGKKNDILYCAAEFEADIYIMDIERSMEDYISYGAIEKIKNGYFMCAKYESKPIIRNPPHLLIFANFKPNIDELSLDRWVIREL